GSPGSLLIQGGLFDEAPGGDIVAQIVATGGLVNLDGSVEGGLTVGAGVTLTGNFTVTGDVIIDGVLNPGHSPGVVTINGNFVQDPTGVLEIQIGGTDPSQYDRLIVNGTMTLGGTLNVTFLNGFVPTVGETFQFLVADGTSGSFDRINMPGLTGE